MHQVVIFGNHPLLFGTVSPTSGKFCTEGVQTVSNHPLLFGTVSPTEDLLAAADDYVPVTTPYCSGLSLLRLTDISEVDRMA